MENLPSLDYALYLTNTVKFHISQTYHIFDEQRFMQGLFALYNDGPPQLTRNNRMWFVQYFLVMALGKALLTRGMSKAASPGNEYFVRALELFPDANGLYQDSILSIEACCGLALYLQAVDHRNSAYVYVSALLSCITFHLWAVDINSGYRCLKVGLALRVALSQGLHRDLMGDRQDDADALRYRNAWWTLYILDRKFSSLMGAPISVHDSDISVPIPTDQTGLRKSNVLKMHTKLSRLMAKVLNSQSRALSLALALALRVNAS